MEHLIASTFPSVLRPTAAALRSDLAAVLRNGSLLSGEVLAGAQDGSLMLSIAGHRVPAQADVDLEPGRFLFRVEESANGVLLRVLDGATGEEPLLLRALREVVAHERPVGEVLGELVARLRALAEQPGAERSALLRALASSLVAHAATGETDGAGLHELLRTNGLQYERLLLGAARGGARPEALQRLAADLKGTLLASLRELPGEGPAREAVARALAGIEAEQLLNVARERAGEPLVWSLPVPDDGTWTTLRLLVHRRGERGGHGEREEQGGTRVVLGVSFAHTGPIRVDLLAEGGALSVRLLALRDEVARRLADDASRLAGLLEQGGRRVHVAARRGTVEEVEVAERPLDTSFLARHKLMDVSG